MFEFQSQFGAYSKTEENGNSVETRIWNKRNDHKTLRPQKWSEKVMALDILWGTQQDLQLILPWP